MCPAFRIISKRRPKVASEKRKPCESLAGRRVFWTARRSHVVKTSYPDLSAVSAGAAATATMPRVLPVSLEPLFATIARNAKRRGYCWAKTETLAAWFGVSRVHMWRLLNKLAAFGRLVIEPVPGSHERRLYPVFLAPAKKRTCSEQVTKTRSHLITSGTSAKAEKTTNSTPPPLPRPATDPVPAVVVSLTQKGMQRNTATRLVALYGEKRAQAALALLAAQKGVKEAAGWLYRAIERGYQPSGNGSEATEGRRHDAAHPSNRDTAANLAAARKAASTPVIVRQPAPPPPRPELAGMTPWERLDALMAQVEGPTRARGQE